MNTSIDTNQDHDKTHTHGSRVLMNIVGAGILLVTVLCLWWARGQTSGTPTDAGDGASSLTGSAEIPTPSLPSPEDDSRTSIGPRPVDPAESRDLPAPHASKELGGAVRVAVRWADDGTAAAGIGVRAVGVEGAASSITRSLETGADGNVSFSDIPSGRWIIASAIGGQTELQLGPGENVACRLELPATRPVEGIVVDQHDTPVPGARVWLSGGVGSHRPTCGPPTDAYGGFAIHSAGNASLIGAFADGYAPSLVCDLPSVSKGPHSVKLVLTGKGGSVEGLVSSESQEAIAFAEVCVEVGGPKVGSRVQGETRTSSYPLTVFTDVEGRFHVIGVCPGRIGVSVRATGYAPWDGFTEVKPGETASMNVTLEQEAALTGVVRTSSGESVANARLSLGAQSDPSRRTEFSNAEGVYTIAGLGAGEFELSVDAGPNGAANLRVELQPREKRKLDIVLDPGVMLVGRVVNTAGVGLPGWAVSAGAKSGREYSTVTVATGEFSIRCDDKSPLWLSLCDSVENQAPLVILQDIMPGERPVICEIRPEDQRTASIKGRLQGEDAGPAANCRVRARKLDKPLVGLELSVESDSEGHFLIGPMQASRYALDAQSRDGAIHGLGEFTLGPEQVLDIGSTVLRRSGSFAMSLRHASGDPVREALIRVRTGDQYELVWKQYKADIDGPLLIVENLAPATYAVVVEAAGLQATTIEVVIRAGEKTNEFVVVGGP